MMQKGGSYHVVIPPKLAYGAASPAGIPPNSTLEFDIHVVDVAPGAASMAAQAQEQQRRQQESPQPQP
jgi:FKBP-type peptidyl-prolyl cis-trans isomerase FkpA